MGRLICPWNLPGNYMFAPGILQATRILPIYLCKSIANLKKLQQINIIDNFKVAPLVAFSSRDYFYRDGNQLSIARSNLSQFDKWQLRKYRG
jgi:hypothetical protein